MESIINQLNDSLKSHNLTIRMIKYYANLIKITEALQNEPSIHHVKDITRLHNEHVCVIRKLARCYGIQNVHEPSKQVLIGMICEAHDTLVTLPSETTTETESMDLGDDSPLLIVPTVSPRELSIQAPLQIGEPRPYDCEEYFDLYMLKNVHSDYPVQFIEKKERVVLNQRTMETFISYSVIALFLNHFRCFKNINNTWYRYNSDNVWCPVFVYDIDEFVLRMYERIESVARYIDNTLPNAFMSTLTDMTIRNAILKRVSLNLQKCVKQCS